MNFEPDLNLVHASFYVHCVHSIIWIGLRLIKYFLFDIFKAHSSIKVLLIIGFMTMMYFIRPGHQCFQLLDQKI